MGPTTSARHRRPLHENSLCDVRITGVPVQDRYARAESFVERAGTAAAWRERPEVANVAAFVASEKASGTTGTIVNLSMGALAD